VFECVDAGSFGVVPIVGLVVVVEFVVVGYASNGACVLLCIVGPGSEAVEGGCDVGCGLPQKPFAVFTRNMLL
jgi:hypothetical protein